MLDPIHAQKPSHARFRGSRILLARMTPRSIFRDPCHMPGGGVASRDIVITFNLWPPVPFVPSATSGSRLPQGLALATEKNDRDD
jgi:hypothetical protein